jgi:hypothetical protein
MMADRKPCARDESHCTFDHKNSNNSRRMFASADAIYHRLLLPDQMLSSRAKFIVQADGERVQIHSTRVIFSQPISWVAEQPRVRQIAYPPGVGEARNAVSLSLVDC